MRKTKPEKAVRNLYRPIIMRLLVSCVMMILTLFSIIWSNVSHKVDAKTYSNSEQSNISAGKYMQIHSEYSKVLLVNKEHGVPADYVPEDMIVPDISFRAEAGEPKTYMQREAGRALEKLFAAAKKDGVELCGVSAYRSYSTQSSLYYGSIYRNGFSYANVYSAKPGMSEHQTGMAIDLSCASVGGSLVTRFAETPEGIWLAQHCAQYGYIVRYPKGKTEITGYAYEPWHIRYVGVRAAEYIEKNDITLDEYPGAVAYESY